MFPDNHEYRLNFAQALYKVRLLTGPWPHPKKIAATILTCGLLVGAERNKNTLVLWVLHHRRVLSKTPPRLRSVSGAAASTRERSTC